MEDIHGWNATYVLVQKALSSSIYIQISNANAKYHALHPSSKHACKGFGMKDGCRQKSVISSYTSLRPVLQKGVNGMQNAVFGYCFQYPNNAQRQSSPELITLLNGLLLPLPSSLAPNPLSLGLKLSTSIGSASISQSS